MKHCILGVNINEYSSSTLLLLITSEFLLQVMLIFFFKVHVSIKRMMEKFLGISFACSCQTSIKLLFFLDSCTNEKFSSWKK